MSKPSQNGTASANGSPAAGRERRPASPASVDAGSDARSAVRRPSSATPASDGSAFSPRQRVESDGEELGGGSGRRGGRRDSSGDSAALAQIEDVLRDGGSKRAKGSKAAKPDATDVDDEPRQRRRATVGDLLDSASRRRRPDADGRDAPRGDDADLEPQADDDAGDDRDDRDEPASRRRGRTGAEPDDLNRPRRDDRAPKRGREPDDRDDDGGDADAGSGGEPEGGGLDPLAEHVFGSLRGGEDPVDDAFSFLIPRLPDERADGSDDGRDEERGRVERRAAPEPAISEKELKELRDLYPEEEARWARIEKALKASGGSAETTPPVERRRPASAPRPSREQVEHVRRAGVAAARALQSFLTERVGVDDVVLAHRYGPQGRPRTPAQRQAAVELVQMAANYQQAAMDAGRTVKDAEALHQAWLFLNRGRRDEEVRREERDRLSRDVRRRSASIDPTPRSAAGGGGRPATGDEAALSVINTVLRS